MMIRNAEVWRTGSADIRVADGLITEIGSLEPHTGEDVTDARGGALLPGLHDHHIHLAATEVAKSSVQCGPPHVATANALAQALAASGSGWLRGVGYHESVAGMLTRGQIDAWQPTRPVRIQHRSGRMWFLNSLAIEELLTEARAPESLDCATGQLFDADDWLRATLGARPPVLDQLSRELAAFGLTGVTEISPSNAGAELRWIACEQAEGRLMQSCVIAGTEALADEAITPRIALGPLKLHLHEHDMPDLDETIARIATAHAGGRTIAVHCTTELELVFTLAAIEAAGAIPGDRIEHAGVADDEQVERIAELGLQIVSQPHFIAERGDQYLELVEPRHQEHLYRLGAFRHAGVTLAAGSDAPYGSTDPWAAMRAAVSRETASGRVIGVGEALTAEQALELFLADPLDLTRQRKIEIGAPADLCLLDRPWNEACTRLDASDVRATLIAGNLVHHVVDEPPIERRASTDATA